MVHWAGWLLFGASFCMLLLFREFRSDTRALVLTWLLLAAHHTVSLVDALLVSLPFEPDADRFHWEAIHLIGSRWRLTVGAEFYTQWLAQVYEVVGPSEFLAQQLTILAFTLSCVVLVKLIGFLGLRSYRLWILLFFGGLPPMLIIGSLALREAYQVLFFMFTAYWALRFHLTGRPMALSLCCFGALAMGLLHKGLILYAAFLIPVLVLWRFAPRPSRDWWRLSRTGFIGLLAGLVFVVALVFAVAGGFLRGSGPLNVVLSAQVLDYIESYRSGLLRSAGRVTYDVPFDLSSPAALARSIAVMYVYYILMPFPWQVSQAVDVYAMSEAWLRLALLGGAIWAWTRSAGPRRRVLFLLLVLYFSMTFLWAFGTSNFGTGIRHHLLTNWILFLAGLPPLVRLLRRQLAVLRAAPGPAAEPAG